MPVLSFPALFISLSVLGGDLYILLQCPVSLLDLPNPTGVVVVGAGGGGVDSSGVNERLAAVLPLCFGEVEVYVWSLATERS